MKIFKPNFLRDSLLKILVVAIANVPMSGTVIAAQTLLADEPPTSASSVRANLMFDLDDSGSMDRDYLPDYANDAFCLDQDDNGSLENCTNTDPPFQSNDLNKIYYDPKIRYTPGVNADGTSKPSQNRLNTTTWTRVLSDPYDSALPTVNLNKYEDSYWCDSSSRTSADFTNINRCRRNGISYGSAPGTPIYNYPNSRDTSGTIFDNRKVTTGLTGAPYYYNISSVQFCSTRSTSGVTKGFGTTSCQSRWTSTYKYVKYGTFTRVDIVSTNNIYPKSPDRQDCAGTTCTYDEEMTNFANWYAYYRTRMLAMKSAGGIAFSRLDATKFRVGFTTINNGHSHFIPIRDFDAGTQKADWYDEFYSINPGPTTPLRGATQKVGEYYRTGTYPGVSAAKAGPDPINASCQLNFHLLATDGYWNETYNPSSSFDRDNIVPALPEAVSGLTPGQPWPAPYRQSTVAPASGEINVNTLADVATYYWATDLRSMPNKVPATANDPATWQHMSNYIIALGADGTIPYNLGTPTGMIGASPTLQWPNPKNDNETGIDDAWHAAVNSRGQYFNAQSGAQLSELLSQALSAISAAAGAGSAAGVDNPDLSTATLSASYSGTYDQGFVGRLTKTALDARTALPTGTDLWNAGDQLNTLAAGNGWDVTRKIATRTTTGTAVPFRFNNLSAAQKTALGSSNVVDYLRGDKSNEGASTGKYRARSGLLGDIIGSEAVIVGQPQEEYQDATDPGYSAFKATTRATVVYAGANDGMLHAFDDATGNEKWAYVPGLMFNSGSAGLQLLTNRVGGVPDFAHRYYVDGTPFVGSVDFNNTNAARGSGDWRTILIGGLNKGGYGYYALDVTNTTAPATEADVASKVLWEFTDGDMGYSFGKPIIAKTRAYGWVVLVTSGYNNPTGRGILYVLDAKTGSVLKKLSTGVGTPADPSGLARFTAYTISHSTNIVEQAYGGDLFGNLWRFNLSDANPNNWNVELLAKLENPSGTPQPITVAPRVQINPKNDTDRWVFIGTGKILHTSDYANTQTQTLYGIRDGSKTTPKIITAAVTRGNLGIKTGTTGGNATANGWYRDLSTKEQVTKDVVADVGLVVFSTSLPPGADPCAPNPSNLYALNYQDGNALLSDNGTNPFFKIDSGVAGATLVKLKNGGIAIKVTAGGTNAASGVGVSNGTEPLNNTCVRNASGNSITCKPTPSGAGAGGTRVNWREIPLD